MVKGSQYFPVLEVLLTSHAVIHAAWVVLSPIKVEAEETPSTQDVQPGSQSIEISPPSATSSSLPGPPTDPLLSPPSPATISPAPSDPLEVNEEASKKLIQEEEERRKMRRRKKGRIRELEEVCAMCILS